METVTTMLHNRKEIITVEKLENGFQQSSIKKFSIDYLKQIKTVFPAAYSYSWENKVGKYGNVLPDFELHISVNTNYMSDTVMQMGGNCVADGKNVVSKKIGPAQVVERKTMFTNSLQNIMIQHHSDFCKNLAPPVMVEEDKLVCYHEDFALDSLPTITLGGLPEKPHVEICDTASEVLEKSRALFQRNPNLPETLSQISSEKKVEDSAASSPALAAPVRKELAGLSQGLQEKIRAKEAAKKAVQMFSDEVHYLGLTIIYSKVFPV